MEIKAKNILKNSEKIQLFTFLLDVRDQGSIDKAKIFVEKNLKPGQGFHLKK